MRRNAKYSAEEKTNAVNEYLSGKNSMNATAINLGIDINSFKKWGKNYESMGKIAFNTESNKRYSKEQKEQAVAAYLAGEGSYVDICKIFEIRSTRQLRDWIKKYNGHEKLKAFGTGGTVIMTKGRTTTFDELVEIASFCIAHDHNYAETAEKFKGSYQQTRNYTIKYENGGIQRLQDNRGKSKKNES